LAPGQPEQRQRGGPLSSPNPTDRGKAGTKRLVVVERQGIPLAVKLTAVNGHDGPAFEPLLEGIPPIRGRLDRPRYRADIYEALLQLGCILVCWNFIQLKGFVRHSKSKLSRNR
jgi:hypothetical protein